MSLPMSVRLGRGQYVVVIAGATGQLGMTVSETFLDKSYKSFFSSVVCLTRNPDSDKSKSLTEKGATLRNVDVAAPNTSEVDIARTLEGVQADILVSTLGINDAEAANKLARAAVKAGVKVYFPSEFGANHWKNDFTEFEHEEWLHKKSHVSYIKKFAKDKMRVVSVYNGMLLEDTLGPWFGFDTSGGTYTFVGPRTTPFALTSKADIGRSLVFLSLLCMSSPKDVSDEIHLAGSIVTVDDIAKAVSKESGKKIEVKEIDLKEFREKTKKDTQSGKVENPAPHIRLIIGEGKMNFQQNDNELVNPGQKNWKWKTMVDYVREMEGEPCRDLLSGERQHHAS
ncbi:NAD-binding protein [Neolentinus lepideus HHB14362 ss-1]|uniref:NAD-binding protein n=1 Tax=Neolentinus lepideus HHB14362 ss-1 TaxID=1314782 RepID=A0A165VTI1_9AGAM|nr:NAD-binding protein [Neolentinus lepideus HHB14362 ss-1]